MAEVVPPSTLRPLTVEEDEVYLRYATAVVPALVELSGLRNCMAGACYASHDHTEEMRKVSQFAHLLAGYLLDDWRAVTYIPAVETATTVQMRSRERQKPRGKAIGKKR